MTSVLVALTITAKATKIKAIQAIDRMVCLSEETCERLGLVDECYRLERFRKFYHIEAQ